MEVKDKVIIVTGASAGIGLAISTILSAKGAKVVLAARASKQLTLVEKQLANSYAIPTDLRKDEDIDNLIETTVNKYGRIDILINNAGQAMAAPVEKIDMQVYKHVVELNIYAPLYAMQKVIPIMRKQKEGTIINVSSGVSKKYIPNIAGYASTKYALNALTLTARQEVEKDNITISIICPGIVNTDFGKNTPYPEPKSLRKAPDGSLLPHVQQPDKVAEAVVKLIQTGDPEVIL